MSAEDVAVVVVAVASAVVFWQTLEVLFYRWCRWKSGRERKMVDDARMAALCPDGWFTREDVELIRAWAQEWPDDYHSRTNDEEAELYDLADRIEALLPPEEP